VGMSEAETLAGTVVRERSVGGQRTVVEVEHDGAAPPLALFAELRAAGWSGLVPTPPPAAAIDWSCPDAAAGTRYTVRSHRAVVLATIEGPPDVRAAALAAAHAAAARHARSEPGGVGPAGGPELVVELVCTAANAPAVLSAAGHLGAIIDDRTETEQFTVTWRGNVDARSQELRRLLLSVRGASFEDVQRGLVGTGVRSLAAVR
jgi:hypothetical protein